MARERSSILFGDEGMWPLDLLPFDRMSERCGFRPDEKWIDVVRGASVRLSSGGSASFVSPEGLVLTNHHVAESRLHAVSTEANDLLRNGFYAATLEDEIPCPGLEANVLIAIDDVTDRVKRAVSDGMSPDETFLAIRAEKAKIQKESFDATGFKSDVITLYQGGRYHLYRYRRFEDVRIVWAPEKAIASFGGDIDNYKFPRFCLDVALLRVWQDGKPLETPHFFRIAECEPTEGAPLFVSGNPGTTSRMNTVARLKSLRDDGMPLLLTELYRNEVSLQQYSGQGVEHRRRARNALHRVQNIRKRMFGQLNALQDPDFIEAADDRETRIVSDLLDAGLYAKFEPAWDMIEDAECAMKELRTEVNMFEGGDAFNTRYFGIARTLLRMAEEDQKPDGERLPEFTTANRPSVLLGLMSPEPIYPDLEEHNFGASLAHFAEVFGIDSDQVEEVLCYRSPIATAKELVAYTKLGDVEERKRLLEGGQKAINASQDPFINLARLVDNRSRAIRRRFEIEVSEVRRKAHAMIAEALFALYGTDVYPDATSSLRLAYGAAKPYRTVGTELPMFTTIREVFDHADRHEHEGDWKLPDRWYANRSGLSVIEAPFNFLSTHDTHGGNSGSPVFDRELKLHGVLFDGLMQEQGRAFLVTNENPDTVSVSAWGMLTLLRTVYRADRIVDELTSA